MFHALGENFVNILTSRPIILVNKVQLYISIRVRSSLHTYLHIDLVDSVDYNFKAKLF